jgi:hypothetical protein
LQRYSERKREKGLIDYNDLERFAYKLLVKSYDSESKKLEITDEAAEISALFSHIFIDEYCIVMMYNNHVFRSDLHPLLSGYVFYYLR